MYNEERTQRQRRGLKENEKRWQISPRGVRHHQSKDLHALALLRLVKTHGSSVQDATSGITTPAHASMATHMMSLTMRASHIHVDGCIGEHIL